MGRLPGAVFLCVVSLCCRESQPKSLSNGASVSVSEQDTVVDVFDVPESPPILVLGGG